MDDFALAEDSPVAAGAASPAVPHQRASAQAVGPPGLHAQPGSADAGASSAYTAQWLDTVPEQPTLAESDHSPICALEPNQAAHAVSDEDSAASQQEATEHPQEELVEPDVGELAEAAGSRPKGMAEQRRISLTAPEDDVCEGEPPIWPSPTRRLHCHRRDPKALFLG